MAPTFIPDDFGGRFIYPDHIEPANLILYHQRIRQIAIAGTERNLWSDMREIRIQDLEVLRLKTIYRMDTVRKVQEKAIEMLNSQKAYQILTAEVGQMPLPLPAGPPPQIPLPPPEEGF